MSHDAQEPVRIALVIGDPAGIGPELVARLLADETTRAGTRVSLIGSRQAIDDGAAVAGTPSPLAWPEVTMLDWSGAEEAAFERGVAGARNGHFMLEMLRLGANRVARGQEAAMCFAPLNKGALRAGGMTQEDEMRWFADLLGWHGSCGELNVLESLWTSRVTSHIVQTRRVAQAIVSACG